MSSANEDKTNVVETWDPFDTDAPFAQSSAAFPLKACLVGKF